MRGEYIQINQSTAYHHHREIIHNNSGENNSHQSDQVQSIDKDVINTFSAHLTFWQDPRKSQDSAVLTFWQANKPQTESQIHAINTML